MEGIWHDRTAYGEARRRGERVSLEDFAEREIVTLSTLPCWQGLSPEEIRKRIVYLLDSIERQHAERRRVEGKGVLGAKAVRRRHPHSKPEKLKRSPAPRFHAATKAAWQALADAYREFMAAFREAAELLLCSSGWHPCRAGSGLRPPGPGLRPRGPGSPRPPRAPPGRALVPVAGAGGSGRTLSEC